MSEVSEPSKRLLSWGRVGKPTANVTKSDRSKSKAQRVARRKNRRK